MLDLNEALMRQARRQTQNQTQTQTKSTARRKTPPSSAKRKRAGGTEGAANSRTKAVKALFASSPSINMNTPTQATPVPGGCVRKTQAYIDLGQKDFGQHVTCPRCGLLYMRGQEEDEKEHKRFCQQQQKGIAMTKWKNERLVKAFLGEDARIIEVRSDDPARHVAKLLEVKAVLDDALGVVDPIVFSRRTHYLYVARHRVLGCVTLERVARAYEPDPTASNLVVVDSVIAQSPNNKTTTKIKSGVAVQLGVCQIWVHPDARRQGIATRLVDTAREKFIYGLHVAKHRVAFAQPTRHGLAFAAHYLSPLPVLVYDDEFESADVSNLSTHF